MSLQALLTVVAAAVAAVVAVALRIDWSQLPEVTRFRDDAYYYFSWASNLATGRGPCVVDGVPTSGVHPLWGLLLVPPALFGVVESAAQWLGLLCHVATAVLLARGGGWIGAAIGLAYLGQPTLLTEAQNGQETALACLLCVATLKLRNAHLAVFSAVAVLALAARSDLLPFVLVAAWLRDGPAWRRAVAPAIALAAYALWNLGLAGTPIQDSAAPIPWLFEQQFERGDPSFGERLGHWWWFGRPVLLGHPFAIMPVAVGIVAGVVLTRFVPRRLVAVPAVVVAAGIALGLDDAVVVAVASIVPWFAARTERRRAREGVAVLAAAIALVALHLLWRNYPRVYYFVPIATAAGWFSIRALASMRLAWVWCGAFVVHGVAVLLAPVPERVWQLELSMAGRFLDRIVGPGEAVGCFNSGLVGWYRGAVLNLDGVVNRPAFDALRRRELGAYLDRHGVRFVVDHPVQFGIEGDRPHECGRYFGDGFDPATDLEEIARFEVPGDGRRPGTESVRLYWRVGRGTRPALPRQLLDLGPSPDGGRFVLWPSRAHEPLRMRIDGSEAPVVIARGEPGVAFVLAIPPGRRGRVRLFEGADPEPVLAFHRL